MTKTALFISILFFTRIAQSFATHIIGGNMSYRYLNNGKYAITMRLYRDCNTGVPIPFDGDGLGKGASIGVFKDVNGSYELVDTLHVFIKQKQLIPVPNYQWKDLPTNVCVEEGIYEFEYQIADFPSKSNYSFAYQRCCRNYGLINILDPLKTGFTCDTEISSDAQQLTNSSAVIKTLPPTIICVNTSFSINLSATDKDNDSLYYRLCKPKIGANDALPAPNVPSSPPFSNVTYKTNYDENNPLGNQSFLLDGKTGILTSNASILGSFVVGICVEEYRNGKLINKLFNDFQFNVGACNLLSESSVTDDNSISISPNPFDNQLNIVLKEKVDKLMIKDFYGRNLIELQNLLDNQVVNTQSLPKGIYFLVIEKGNSQVVKKIIKS